LLKFLTLATLSNPNAKCHAEPCPELVSWIISASKTNSLRDPETSSGRQNEKTINLFM
jgi:hypothetical protein